jgi:hypothetical protein
MSMSLMTGATIMLTVSLAAAGEPARDATCFQVAAPYEPRIDIGSDVAIVYGTGSTFAERVAKWREMGYTVSMMTGISWGDYGDYYQTPDGLKVEEIQTRKNGTLFMHGHSTDVGYNVPTPAYVEYIKKVVDPAIDEGVQAIYLEEPEFWVHAGWSQGFKDAWQDYFGTPWVAPDSSPDAQYKASRLKYEVYFDALREVMAHIDKRAAEKGISIECHVPTHSLINYAHWGIVSPESHLIDIPSLDGYIAQVWTDTARTQNVFRGVAKERVFETAYLEFGQMANMVRPTGKKVWFLADPVQDNPNFTWEDYQTNYINTITASLMWPDIHRYEVMPWPDRIFNGRFAVASSDERMPIPPDYATLILLVVNTLNEMNQPDVSFDAGPSGIGVIVSDSMMFQRGNPTPSDPALGGFYGIAMPLLKQGVPVEPVQLENTLQEGSLDPFRVLFLTYEYQKPLKPEYHDALAEWTRNGGILIYIGDGADPYHAVSEWWNENGKTKAKPEDDLFARLGADDGARGALQPCGNGHVRILGENPADIQKQADGSDKVTGLLREALDTLGVPFTPQAHIALRRGPYTVAAVLDESDAADSKLTLPGRYVDMLDIRLPVVENPVFKPFGRALLRDLPGPDTTEPVVLAASCRVRDFNTSDGACTFTGRGPADTGAVMRVWLPGVFKDAGASDGVAVEAKWDADTSTVYLQCDNIARDVQFTIRYE